MCRSKIVYLIDVDFENYDCLRLYYGKTTQGCVIWLANTLYYTPVNAALILLWDPMRAKSGQ